MCEIVGADLFRLGFIILKLKGGTIHLNVVISSALVLEVDTVLRL